MKMDDWDFDLFRDDLKKAVLKLYKDKCSIVETYVDCENKEYRVIIEEVKDGQLAVKKLCECSNYIGDDD
jgi:hypothetical protein